MIKTVIFDIGGVLIDFRWPEFSRDIFGDRPEDIERFSEDFWNSGIWSEMDRGVWPEEKVWEELFKKLKDYEYELGEVKRRFSELLVRKEQSIPWIQDLKAKGYKVLYLSNYSDFVIDAAPEVLDFILYMDGGVFSHRVHMIKPNADIYAEICRQYDLDPAECIFTDDTLANVEGAKAFGMNALLFEGHEKGYPMIMDYLKENGEYGV